MTLGRDLRRQFAQQYLGAKFTTLTFLRSDITHYVDNLRTVVVDTIHLTDGSQVFTDTWTLPGTHGSPKEIAYRATSQSLAPLMRGLHEATAQQIPHTVKPVHGGSSDIEWTAWHQGSVFELTAAGTVEALLHYCDVTENEREQIIIAARRLARDGHIVYATALATSPTHTPEHNSMTFDGLVVCTLNLLPNTLQAVTRLRARGVRLVLVTSLPEDMATFVAEAAHITEYSELARHSKFVTDTQHTIYAGTDKVTARPIIKNLPQPLLISRHPLSLLVDMLDACD